MTLTSEKRESMANEPYIAQHRICVTREGVVCDCDSPEAATMLAAKGRIVPKATVQKYGLRSPAVKRVTPARDKAVKGPPADKSADESGAGDGDTTEGDADAEE